jgi:hypothetical protein
MEEKTYRFTITSPSGYHFKVRFTIYSTSKDNKKIDGVFYLGNPKTKKEDACVTITIHFPESVIAFRQKHNREPIFDSSIATLVLTKYNQLCSENKTLPQKEGTIEMINGGLTLVKRICPFVKSVNLKDMSSRACDDGSSISLPLFYITIHRQTWYEKQFHARLRPTAMYDAYKTAIQNFFSTPLEPFNIFMIHFLRECNDSILSNIQTAYNTSKTMDEFFKTLYKNNGIPMGCILLNKWIAHLMSVAKISPYMDHEWFIDIEDVPLWKLNNTAKLMTISKKERGTRRNSGIWLDGVRIN